MDKEFFNSLFFYSNGMIFWKESPSPRVFTGDRAGTPTDDGYRAITINGKKIREHRVIWVMHYDKIPSGMFIDHIDLNPLNNGISNLRLCTPRQNVFNQKKHKRNTTGFKGVRYHRVAKAWYATISINGKPTHLGTFRSPELASEAYNIAAIKHHGQFANF